MAEGRAGVSADEMRGKFDTLRSEKEETEKAENEKTNEAQRKFEEHEQIISDDPRDHATNALLYWWVEDDQFWKRWGKHIATPNLIHSILNLFMCFAVLIHWHVIVRAVLRAHLNDPTAYEFGYTSSEDDQKKWKARVEMLPYLSAFSGATHRVINCWMTGVVGGRVHTVMNTLVICVPMLLSSIGLSVKDCPFVLLWMCAILSGIGGGAFSSCVNNMSCFYPKRHQGFILGLVAGLGNLGEAFALALGPQIASIGFCAAGKGGECDAKDFGRKYAFNLGVFWVVCCLAVAIPAMYRLNSIPGHGENSTKRNIINYFQLTFIGVFWTVIGGIVWLFTNEEVAVGGGKSGGAFARIIGLSIGVFILVQLSLFYFTTSAVKEKLRMQMTIMRTREIWCFALLCSATFGSFVLWVWGFVETVQGSYIDKSGSQRDVYDVDKIAFIGPLFGGLARVLGGYFADKYGGATITQWSLVGLTVGTVFVLAMNVINSDSENAESQLPVIVIACTICLVSSAMGAGGVFRQIAFLYPPETRGPALGFVSGVASFAGLIGLVLVVQGIINEFVSVVLGLLCFVYVTSIFLNFWLYKRAVSQKPC